jgi:DNA-binding protein HU-beta
VTAPEHFLDSERYGKIMVMPVKLKGPIPSIEETAAEVGVSAKRVAELGRLADHTASGSLARSLAKRSDVSAKVAEEFLEVLSSMAISEIKKNGVFVLPGIGRLVRVERKARKGRNPATGESIRIPAKKVVKFRVAKAAKDAIVPPQKT